MESPTDYVGVALLVLAALIKPAFAKAYVMSSANRISNEITTATLASLVTLGSCLLTMSRFSSASGVLSVALVVGLLAFPIVTLTVIADMLGHGLTNKLVPEYSSAKKRHGN